MKVLVTGVNGQLGFDVCKELDRRNIENKGIDRESCDITDENAVSAYIKNYAPDVVIHCAAYTAVDRAEDEKERRALWAVSVLLLQTRLSAKV